MPTDRSSHKLRRWIDLIVALLRRRHAASFDDIKNDIPAYATAKVAPESLLRTFERDKDELIAFGVPIEVSCDAIGVRRLYSIAPGDFFLPYLDVVEAQHTEPDAGQRSRGGRAPDELAFTPDELDIVVRAGRRVQQLGDPHLALDAAGALRKLAFDMPVPRDDGREQVLLESALDDPGALDLLDRALRAGKLVRFNYH